MKRKKQTPIAAPAKSGQQSRMEWAAEVILAAMAELAADPEDPWERVDFDATDGPAASEMESYASSMSIAKSELLDSIAGEALLKGGLVMRSTEGYSADFGVPGCVILRDPRGEIVEVVSALPHDTGKELGSYVDACVWAETEGSGDERDPDKVPAPEGVQ